MHIRNLLRRLGLIDNKYQNNFKQFQKKAAMMRISSSPSFPLFNDLLESGLKKFKGVIINIIETNSCIDEDVLSNAIINSRNPPCPLDKEG